MTDREPPLAVHACLSLCSWSATRETWAGERLFRCSGCGSEWVASEPWTPADVDGSVSPEVQAELRSRAASQVTSGPGGAGADTADR